ncbi:hypothetical protein C8J56DRAFT_541069 [Mycena floridula]|nr:hypothetical protein C8J56DRAFT_541069 [Mycena floridula]
MALLSTIQSLKLQSIEPHVTHLFASSAEDVCALLEEIIHTTDQVSNSLNEYLAMPLSNPKLVSIMRQHSGLLRTLHLSDQNIRQTIEALRKRSGINYGEDIPLDRTTLVEWCISRFESWGNEAGMEMFRDEGSLSLVLGGKVLVIDVDFSIDKSNPLEPVLAVENVKTSYADASGLPNTDGSISLDAFLKQDMRNFCAEVQKEEESRNPVQAAKLGTIILDHLRYLVTLDRLAARKDDGGIKWFVDLDQLCSVLENFAKDEAKVIANSLSLPRAPLDIYLLRSHALPLPYLTFPSISLLVYLSPRAYLTLLRQISRYPHDESKDTLPKLDIPLPLLRLFLATPQKGATIATLSLTPPSPAPLFPASMSMPTLTSRPTFALVPRGSELEHVFPHTADPSSSMAMDVSEDSSSLLQHTWVLDFTDGGQNPGVVLSQSRMREIELVVNPLSSMDHLNGPMSMMSFGTGSWVDLLLNPSNPISPERYTALYQSPTSAHPPLQLRLTAPEEPGFLLQKVPVHSMKEVWGILEVVREQCWLNETLLECHWTTEGLKMDKMPVDELPEEEECTDLEAELQAVLAGTIIPRKIPVNVFLPSSPDSNTLFDSSSSFDSNFMNNNMQPRSTKIVMSSPERAPMSGLVQITVSYDETRPRGIGVQITGAMGAEIKVEDMEEICRRGGTLGLSGRVWAKSHVLP